MCVLDVCRSSGSVDCFKGTFEGVQDGSEHTRLRWCVVRLFLFASFCRGPSWATNCASCVSSVLESIIIYSDWCLVGNEEIRVFSESNDSFSSVSSLLTLLVYSHSGVSGSEMCNDSRAVPPTT